MFFYREAMHGFCAGGSPAQKVCGRLRASAVN
jgi:hypothetical protein